MVFCLTGTWKKEDLPSSEETKTIIENSFEGEEIVEDSEKEILNWIFSELLKVVVGQCWKPIIKPDEKDKDKQSFFKNVLASDMGFCYYLLKFYGNSALKYRHNNGKEKKSQWNRENQEKSIEYYSKMCHETKKYNNMSVQDKIGCEERIVSFLKTASLEEKDESDSDNLEEEAEIKQETTMMFMETNFFDIEIEEL